MGVVYIIFCPCRPKHTFWKCFSDQTYKQTPGHTVHGSDWNKMILQKELRWSFILKATTPPGLNASVSKKHFLQGFTPGTPEV